MLASSHHCGSPGSGSGYRRSGGTVTVVAAAAAVQPADRDRRARTRCRDVLEIHVFDEYVAVVERLHAIHAQVQQCVQVGVELWQRGRHGCLLVEPGEDAMLHAGQAGLGECFLAARRIAAFAAGRVGGRIRPRGASGHVIGRRGEAVRMIAGGQLRADIAPMVL